jgi:predicted nucleic acid-binding protein
MTSIAVVNSSPLICLSRAGLGDLLRLAGDKVLVPSSVSREILARGTSDATATFVTGSTWLHQAEDPIVPAAIVAWDLGAGESAVLALALATPSTRAIIDDLQGLRCADALGIPLRGTVGLILRARRAGVIASARHALSAVRAAGLFLSDRICAEVLREVGEEP